MLASWFVVVVVEVLLSGWTSNEVEESCLFQKGKEKEKGALI
jgi:hypothetical protein